jgi:NADH-quinone oxidoreductase subunit M
VENFPWLTVLAALPLVGGVAVMAVPRGRERLARQAALAVSLVVLVLTLAISLDFDRGRGGEFQYDERYAWIPQFGVSYAVGVDGIGLVMLALVAVLTPLCIAAGWHDADESTRRPSTYFGLMLLLEAFVIGVFIATDVFLFYVFFEAMLVPMYFLIGTFGGAQRSYAAVKFFLYSLFGGLLMLAALIALYVASPGGEQAFLLSNLVGIDIDPTTQKWLFVGFFTAFAIKAPLWPVHTWLPDAAAETPTGGAVMMISLLDKVGTFGMLRLVLPLFPEASRWATPVVLVLGVVTILYAALLAVGQTDLKRMLAYVSLSHMGFVVIGIFAATSQGQSGATLYMVNTALGIAGLFFIVGMMSRRRGSRLIGDFGGWQRVTPLLAGTFLVIGLANLAMPGLGPFVSEFLVLIGTYTRYPVAAVVATVGIILAALYVLVLYQRTMTGRVRNGRRRP